MNSMNDRFRGLLGSKRKSSAGNPNGTPGSTTPTGSQRPTSLSPQNSSSSSLPMNPQQNPLGRPPSYTYAQSGGLGTPQQQHGRPASPLPPINTGAPGGYPPQQQPMGYPPQQGGPPGYPSQPPPGQYGGGQQYGAPPPNHGAPPGPPAQQYRPPGMAEVAGEGRSKAQLIVGIDFVSAHCLRHLWRSCSYSTGHHLLWRRIRLRDQHGSQRRHHHRMARRWKPNQAEGASTSTFLAESA
jgi:hypothetical protein